MRQALRDLTDQFVSDGVPQGIVDLLESVQVEEHHRDLDAVPPRALERNLQTILEQHPVRQTRQRVVVRIEGHFFGQRLQALLVLFALRDVQHDAARPLNFAHPARRDQAPDPDGLPGACKHPKFQ